MSTVTHESILMLINYLSIKPHGVTYDNVYAVCIWHLDMNIIKMSRSCLAKDSKLAIPTLLRALTTRVSLIRL